MSYIGRLAPSPTGAQHVGNARTYLVAWLLSRQFDGKLLLRVEDLDTPRTKPGAMAEALEDLAWLGIDWDPVDATISYITQSERESRYQEVLDQLKSRELIYPCCCSRTDIDRASATSEASAPHESVLDGAVYPGTCAGNTVADAEEMTRQGKVFSWRFRMPTGTFQFHDQLHGSQHLDAKSKLGDFVIARSSGVTAYQLAVVIDDHDFEINHVVRGDDLIYSTYRQIALYQTLQWPCPAWLHVPLVTGVDGHRLAKRHGDSRLSSYRKQGVHPQSILGYLGCSLGLIPSPEPVLIRDLLAIARTDNSWVQRVSRCPLVFQDRFQTVTFGTTSPLAYRAVDFMVRRTS
jgi:glutamyl-tRNA synthetase